MKLHNIIENEYDGLEDNDEFANYEEQYIRIGGQFRSHHNQANSTAEVKKELISFCNTLGMQYIDTIRLHKHVITLYFHSETPHQDVALILNKFKQNSYLIEVPSGQFDIDLIDVYYP